MFFKRATDLELVLDLSVPAFCKRHGDFHRHAYFTYQVTERQGKDIRAPLRIPTDEAIRRGSKTSGQQRSNVGVYY